MEGSFQKKIVTLPSSFALPVVSNGEFWAKVREAQMEKYGRLLNPLEQIEALKDEHHILAKLAREGPKPN